MLVKMALVNWRLKRAEFRTCECHESFPQDLRKASHCPCFFSSIHSQRPNADPDDSFFGTPDPEDATAASGSRRSGSTASSTRASRKSLVPSAQASMTTTWDDSAFDDNFGLLPMDSVVVVRPYRGEDDDEVLQELRPRYIIMYDAEQTFTRRIEVS